MRAIWLGLAVMGLSFTLFAGAEAGGDKAKEVTLKGTITCGKCELKVTKTCATVIVTKEAGKDVVTYFDAAGHKKFHNDTCNEPMKGTVTGVVTTSKDNKRTIAVSSVKYE